jgi:uncharacterized delta-60 repeat protein
MNHHPRRHWKNFHSILFLMGNIAAASAQSSLFDPSLRVGPGADGPVNALAILTNGQILVGGQFTNICGQPWPNLARLQNNGQLDTSFGTGVDGPVYTLLQQPDGKMLVGGDFTHLLGVPRNSLGRLLTNGVVDPGFDPGSNLTNSTVLSLALQSDGKVLVGATGPDYSYASLTRLTTTGQPDPAFVNTNFFSLPAYSESFIHSILPLTNGTILVGGAFQLVNTNTCTSLALFDTNGVLDASANFGLTNSPQFPTIFSLVEVTNSGIYVGGIYYRQNQVNATQLSRLTPALSWDGSWIPDPIGFNTLEQPFVRCIVPQPDGHLLAGGSFYTVGGYWRTHIARFDAQGHVDPCFDPGLGLAGYDGTYTLALQTDGRVLVGGNFDATLSGGTTNIAKLLPSDDCGVTRAYLLYGGQAAAGTCTPGGTNLLQASTNLVDWNTLDTETNPYVYWSNGGYPPGPSAHPAFFRVKKVN